MIQVDYTSGTPNVDITGGAPVHVDVNRRGVQGPAGPAGPKGEPGMGYAEGQQLALAAQTSAAAADTAADRAETALAAQFMTQDEGVATLINDPIAGPQTQAALDTYARTSFATARATIAPGSAATAGSVAARNAATTPLPNMLGLISGGTPAAELSTSVGTVTAVQSPTNPNSTVQRVTGTAVTSVSLRRIPPAAINGSPANAVSMWVYLSDPAAVSYVRPVLICTGGTWTRQSNQAGSNVEGQALKRGWNLIRIAAHAANPGYTYLGSITQVRAEVFYTAATDADVHFGPVVIEQRPKASVVIVNDWGSKPFLDNGYPALLSRGYPCSWALRPNRLGTGTYPDNQITWAEAHTLAGENNNHVSMHSYNGDVTSTMTGPQCLDDVLNAQAALSVQGLFGEASVHRLAWTQNVAPNAPASFDHLATSATWAGSSSIVPWPPFDRHNIARIALHDQTAAFIDSTMASLEATREAAVIYTHGVVPDVDDAPFHATQTEWDYFIGKLDAGVAAGWLEVVTIPQLVARDRLVLPVEPPA